MSTAIASLPEVDQPPPWVASGRIPSLDGLRAVAIALVIHSHLIADITGHERSRLDGELGQIGVNIFFVISGFLITLLLLREESRSGRISLGDFYRRRALRILPAYLAYLGFAWIMSRVVGPAIPARGWIAALTYTINFIPHDAAIWPIGHAWSLSVEEHFYLVWPVVFLVAGRRTAIGFLAAALILAPVWRYVINLTVHGPYTTMFWTPARMDFLAGGCLLAYLATSPAGARWVGRSGRSSIAVVLGAVATVLVSRLVLGRSWRYSISLHDSATALALCALVLACVAARPGSLIGRGLNSRPLIALGVLSYSLYLWQQAFLDHDNPAWRCRWPQNFVLAVGCAVASRHLIELPFLRFKDRIGRVRHG